MKRRQKKKTYISKSKSAFKDNKQHHCIYLFFVIDAGWRSKGVLYWTLNAVKTITVHPQLIQSTLGTVRISEKGNPITDSSNTT